MDITLGSLFDGSGGFPLAGTLCGIRPIWASEIEPYPIAVTKSRFPDMKHLGDISKVNGADIEPVDIITFGSPCQDLSVAGKRAGLKHEVNGDAETTRSGLFMEAIRIIKEMRCATNGKYPRFALWENVPGAFSSNSGEDFRIVLEELIKIIEPNATVPPAPKSGWPYADAYVGDGWSLAYRTFDAQHWGVPQRRRRIYLITDFTGRCATGILFKRQGLRGYFTQGRSPWQKIATNAERSVGTDDPKRKDDVNLRSAAESNLAACLYASYGTKWNGNAGAYNGENFVLEEKNIDNKIQTLYENHWQEARHKGPLNMCPTLPARLGTGGNNTPFVVEEIEESSRYVNDEYNNIQAKHKASDHNVICRENARRNGELTHSSTYVHQLEPITFTDIASTLCAGAETPKHESDFFGRLVGQPVVFTQNQRNEVRDLNGKTGALAANHGMKQQIEKIVLDDQGGAQIGVRTDGKSPTLRAEMHGNVPCVVQHISNVAPINDKATRYKGGGPSRNNDGSGNGLGVGKPGDPAPTLTAGDRHAVAYLASGKACTGTLMANAGTELWTGNQENSSGDYHIIETKRDVQYFIRRLTPIECARLQGFPDTWGIPEIKKDFTEEEYEFWLGVRNTHAAINGKKSKDYTKEQILAWYNKLHSNTSEYKMWGNGVALPPTLYCMQGISDALSDAK